MRKSVLAGIFAYALFFVVPQASAEAAPQEYLHTVSLASIKPALVAVNEAQTTVTLADETNVASPGQTIASDPEITYTILKGDTLTTIAANHNTTWVRIFYKNTNMTDPDHINPGEVIVIPHADEQLTQRPIPENAPPMPELQKSSAGVQAAPRSVQSSAPVSRGSNSGNLYVAGYCTWYVKNMRPDLPNNLGDAVSWVTRARAQGMATGTTPQSGAVGQRGNHVVYVESVNNDGTVTISEMNHVGWNKMSRRTLPANYFTYIY